MMAILDTTIKYDLINNEFQYIILYFLHNFDKFSHLIDSQWFQVKKLFSANCYYAGSKEMQKKKRNKEHCCNCLILI